MADIDKGLPNTRTKIDVPSEEELQEEVSVQEPEQEKGPVEVIPEEDGGATIDFEPGAINIPALIVTGKLLLVVPLLMEHQF